MGFSDYSIDANEGKKNIMIIVSVINKARYARQRQRWKSGRLEK